MNLIGILPFFFPDTGQKKTLDKKDGRRMSFQKPKGTIEYTVSYLLSKKLFFFVKVFFKTFSVYAINKKSIVNCLIFKNLYFTLDNCFINSNT